MPTHPTPGRSVISRRAIADIVCATTLGSYGVTGFAGGLPSQVLSTLGIRQTGLRLGLRGGLEIELQLTIAYGLPVAEVARQVDSAVRHAIRRALGREVTRLTVHVDGLRYQPGGPPPSSAPKDRPPVATADLADSGTDVA